MRARSSADIFWLCERVSERLCVRTAKESSLPCILLSDLIKGVGKVSLPASAAARLRTLVTSSERRLRHEEEEESGSAGLETIRIAAAMLSAPSVHQNIMGLEGLASLTDEYTIGTATATRASAEILAGANPDSATVRDMILTLVAGGIYRSDSLPDLDDDLDSDDDDDDFGSSSSVDGSEYLRILALSVLVNVLERSEGSKGFLLNLRVPFEDMIVPALLRDLSRSDRDQESADLASAALIHLVRALGRDSAFLRDHLLAQGARDLLVKANFVGEACFENLRKRTALCLAELDSYSSLL